MAPLRGQPGVIEVEPAIHCADVECGHDRVELVRGTRHPRAARQGGPRHDRAQQFRAGRIVERLETAGQRIHQAVVGGFESQLAVDLVVTDVVGDIDERLVPIGALGRAYIDV